MRLLFLYILFAVFFSQKMAAQMEFAPVGATWYYTQVDITGAISYITLHSISTDTILGIECRNIDGHFFYADSLHLYYYEGLANQWTLIADFSKDIGETFNMIISQFYIIDSVEITIIDKGYITVNGYDLPWIEIDDYHVSMNHGIVVTYSGKIIQNIGSSVFLIPFTSTADPAPGPLRCYEDGNIGLYQSPVWDNACDNVNIEEIPGTGIEIFVLKSLSENEMLVKILSPVHGKLQLVNTLGKVIYECPVSQSDTEIFFNLVKLSRGIYYVTFISDSTRKTLVVSN